MKIDKTKFVALFEAIQNAKRIPTQSYQPFEVARKILVAKLFSIPEAHVTREQIEIFECMVALSNVIEIE